MHDQEVLTGIIIALGVIIFFWIYLKKKTAEQKEKDLSIAEFIYEKAKVVAKDIINYVEQISKNAPVPLANAEKKELTVFEVKNILKELYGWDANEKIIAKDLITAQFIYNEAKIVVKDVIDYVEQISKSAPTPLTNKEKKELVVSKVKDILKNILKELCRWDVNEIIIDLAIEAAIWDTTAKSPEGL